MAYIAATMEQISTSIEEVASTTSELSLRGQHAFDSANEGQGVVKSAVEGMRDVAELVRDTAGVIGLLNTQSDKIGVIVGVIKDIADQTNLPALNAAIEGGPASKDMALRWWPMKCVNYPSAQPEPRQKLAS